MKTKLTIGFLVAFMMSLTVGCIREDVTPPEYDPTSLILRINFSDGRNMRATEPGQDIYKENAIGDETLLAVFYCNGNKVWQAQPNKLNDAYLIPVPEAISGEFDGVKEFDIYLIANKASFSAPTTETELTESLVENRLTMDSDGCTEDALVLIGSTKKVINMNTSEGKQLGTIDLKRLAAKIRLQQPVVQVVGYILEGNAEVKFRNYVNKAYLLKEARPEGDVFGTIEYRPLTELGNTAHFYSYFNSWNETTLAEQRPELVMMLNLKKEGEPAAKPYYYRIPIKASGNKIQSNYLYDMSVTVEVLGSIDQGDLVELQGSISVKDWEVHEDSHSLPDAQYLEVFPQEAEMNMIEEFEIKYHSSHDPISIENLKAQYTYTNGSTGEHTTDNYPEGNPQYPQVTIDTDKHIIRVSSILPVNNVPKEISFTVKNGVNMTKTVWVKQNPSQFIINTVGTGSSWSPDGTLANGLNNKAIYHIVTLSPPPEGNMILGFPPKEKADFYSRSGLFNYNYNVEKTDYITKRDGQTAKMVSPSFELASQLGATQPQVYSRYWNGTDYFIHYDSPKNKYALLTCAYYTETRKDKDGKDVILDDWRLPTEAEIELVDKLQNDSNSAVKSIMTGHYYWDARGEDGAHEMIGGSEGSSSNAYVRCVRDVKDDRYVKQAMKK